MRRPVSMPGACADCLTRTWLLGRLAGHLDPVRGRIDALLELDDDGLIAAVAGDAGPEIRNALARRRSGTVRGEAARIEAARIGAARIGAARVGAAQVGAARAELQTVCRCQPEYPPPLRDLINPPAVLHIAGGRERGLALLAGDAVAIVGARRASPYGRDLAAGIARGLAAAGVTVLSGMALGIDGAAHAGALAVSGSTVAVLPGGADLPYPAAHRALHGDLVRRAAAVSELGPGTSVRRWMFPARSRIIAALAAMTVVVEATERSGALLTAGWARRLDRELGAVPGRVGTPQAEGPNALLADGARVVRSTQDVLDHLFGAGARTVPEPDREPLEPGLARLRTAIAEGCDTTAALGRAGITVERGLTALAELELGGHIRRGPGGRFTVIR